jgi:hypothetical protein
MKVRFWLAGNPSETTDVVNNSAVQPPISPAGLTGKVVVNGSGSVNFTPGGGVSFQACCTNANNAYFKFTGAPLANVFGLPHGEISFTLTSKHSFAQRLTAAKRYAFDVRDGSGDHLFYFLTQVVAGKLQFAYALDGTSQTYNVPAGTEDKLFGNGVALKVLLKWDGSSMSLFLNGALANATPYVAGADTWSAASIFDIGAFENLTSGGYNVTDEPIANFLVASPTLLYINGDSTEVSSVQNGGIVTPSMGPAGLTGKVVVNGTGSVHFSTGGGVYFLTCCTNTNNALYRFTGASLNNIFNAPVGQISFTLQSRYSFAQRQTTAASPRYAFDVLDSGNANNFFFMTQVASGRLSLNYQIAGVTGYYFVPAGTEDKLFGSGISLNVMLQWDGSSIRLFLNGVVVKTTAYVPQPGTSFTFDLGANEYGLQGGFNSSDDYIRGFAVTAENVGIVSPAAVTSTAPPPAVPMIVPPSAASAGAAPESGGLSLACDSDTAAAGSTVLCRLAGAAPDAEISLTSDSPYFRTPATATAPTGRSGFRFAAAAMPDAPAGPVTLQVSAGESSVRTTVQLVRSSVPSISAGGIQAARPGSPVRFDVSAQEAASLSASSLPAGALFDSYSGAFSWTPTISDLGIHHVTFTATNSSGVNTASVEINVAPENATVPVILTVGEEEQALALHLGSPTLVSVPGSRYSGRAGVPGDLIAIAVSGIECTAGATAVTVGGQYAAVRAAESVDGATGVCRLVVELPAHAAGARVPVSVKTPGPANSTVASNTAWISVED